MGERERGGGQEGVTLTPLEVSMWICYLPLGVAGSSVPARHCVVQQEHEIFKENSWLCMYLPVPVVETPSCNSGSGRVDLLLPLDMATTTNGFFYSILLLVVCEHCLFHTRTHACTHTRGGRCLSS